MIEAYFKQFFVSVSATRLERQSGCDKLLGYQEILM